MTAAPPLQLGASQPSVNEVPLIKVGEIFAGKAAGPSGGLTLIWFDAGESPEPFMA